MNESPISNMPSGRGARAPVRSVSSIHNSESIPSCLEPNANFGSQFHYNNVKVQVVEQPTPNKHRFRYECEGRALGALTGVSNKKTFPTIKILGYKGPAIVVVSCVTDEEPYKAHPHKLVGKSCNKGKVLKFDKGVGLQEINTDDMTAEFTHLGIQCVTRAMGKYV